MRSGDTQETFRRSQEATRRHPGDTQAKRRASQEASKTLEGLGIKVEIHLSNAMQKLLFL